MKIKIEINSKELSTLVGDSREPIAYDFEIDVYTESQKTIGNKQETAIFAGIFWALCTMLPHSIIASIFKKWNMIVEELQQGIRNKATNTIADVLLETEE